jgi:hypothetical protein
MAVLALAVLWLPVSVHCQLEQLPGLEFLSCCDHEDTTAPHQDDDCEGDACAVIESGLYKFEDQQASAPAPDFGALEFAAFPSDQALIPAVVGGPVGSTAPPEFSRIWQFTSRTALPPRAPSLAS